MVEPRSTVYNTPYKNFQIWCSLELMRFNPTFPFPGFHLAAVNCRDLGTKRDAGNYSPIFLLEQDFYRRSDFKFWKVFCSRKYKFYPNALKIWRKAQILSLYQGLITRCIFVQQVQNTKCIHNLRAQSFTFHASTYLQGKSCAFYFSLRHSKY